MKEILVTGASAVTPLGRDLASTRGRLARGESAFAPLGEGEAPPRRHVSPAARIGAFSTEPELPRGKARRLDRGSCYALVAARQLLAASGYGVAGREEETGVVVGTGSAGAGPLVEIERQLVDETPETVSPFLFPYTVANAPASLVSIELAAKGPDVTITQKDPAGLNALYYAEMLLLDGRARTLLAGAVDEWNPTYHLAYERIRATRTASRPGFVLSEGAAFVLLEEGSLARERGARPWARLLGSFSCGAPVSPQRRRATPGGVASGIRAALEAAGVRPGDVGLVHAAANGVPWTDAAEAEALASLFGDRPRVETVKRQIGENPVVTALQLALAAAALRDDPSLGVAVVDALGAGGNQVVAVLGAAA